MPTVRLWGHAGSDVEAGYRTREDIVATEAADPIYWKGGICAKGKKCRYSDASRALG